MNFKARNKLTIGLTGGILCGKSTALQVWQRLGAFVLSCDDLVREISARPSVQKELVSVFGLMDRGELTKRVFTNKQDRLKLEHILHPLVMREIVRRLKKNTAQIRVIEVPLLFEAAWQDKFDLTVALLAPKNVLSARAKKRGLTQTDLLKRSKVQLPQEQKAARADICILNGGSEAELTAKVKILHKAFSKIYNVK